MKEEENERIQWIFYVFKQLNFDSKMLTTSFGQVEKDLACFNIEQEREYLLCFSSAET